MMTAAIEVAILSAIAVGLIAMAAWIALKVHGSPEKRERRRRLNVSRTGRLGDAMISEATETTLYYFYSVRGVHYTASQDISSLRPYLPAEPQRLIGVSGLKYSTKNPANSILVCEEWSGLRAPAEPPGAATQEPAADG